MYLAMSSMHAEVFHDHYDVHLPDLAKTKSCACKSRDSLSFDTYVQSAWKVCSGSLWQIGQRSDSSKPLLCLFGHVGSEFVTTRYAKFLTVGAAFVFHMRFQHLLVPSGDELEANSDALHDSSKANLKADLRKKDPNRPGPEARVTSSCLREVRIFRIYSTSQGRK